MVGTFDADLLRDIASVMRAGSTSKYPNTVTCWPADGAMRIKSLAVYGGGKYADAEHLTTIGAQEAQIAPGFEFFQINAVYLADAVAAMDGPVTIRRTVKHETYHGTEKTGGLLHLSDTHGHTAIVCAMTVDADLIDVIGSPSVSQ